MRTSLHCLKFVTCALITLPVISVLNLQAQDYLIDFLASGGTKSLTTVKVENLTQGTSLEMNGNDVLHLIGTPTAIETVTEKDATGRINFYPNPMNDYSRMQFILPEPGLTMISLYDILGRRLFQTRDLLSRGQHVYTIQGVKEGIYLVTVSSGKYSFTGRLISSGSQSINTKIIYDSSEDIVKTEVSHEKQSEAKGLDAETVMNYNTGDRLKFTGISGSYRNVFLDIPSESKTITFEFIPCSDRDGNNYSVVKIGNQIWMAENLRTTTYNNGDSIGTTTPASLDITNEASPKYQWSYNGDENNVAVYGRLYTWHTVNDSRYICPAGWYVPTDDEWTTMTDYLTNNGFGYEGSGNDIAKSMAASGWSNSSTPGHVGNDQASNNSSGFSALPGGWRDWEGPFQYMGKGGLWFTSSEKDDANAWYRMIYYNMSDVTRGSVGKIGGLAVRCIRDQSMAIPEAYPGISGEHKVYIIGGDTLHVRKIDDKYIWEGDIVLTEEQLTSGEGKGAGINSFIRRWFCTVYYKINSNQEYRRASILAAIDHVKSSTSVDFAEWTDPEMKVQNYVEFVWDDSSNMSDLGMIGGRQCIWLTDRAVKGTIIHEIGHTIGLIHEHSRSDRDKYVKVLYNNIQPFPKDPYFLTNNFDTITTRYISPNFDFESIMLYHSYAFSKGYPNYPTILKKEGGFLNPSQNSLTPADIELINEIYKTDTVKDINGNIYSTITIGKQIWMKEDLKTTRFNDGESIPWYIVNMMWTDPLQLTPRYYPGSRGGGTYNFFAVNTGKLCPTGWHVPTYGEFKWLIDTLGGEENAGVALMMTGLTNHVYATNETCFTAYPEWNYNWWGADYGCGIYWTTSESDIFDEYGYWKEFLSYALHVSYNCESSEARIIPKPKPYLYQVRCIKNQPAP